MFSVIEFIGNLVHKSPSTSSMCCVSLLYLHVPTGYKDRVRCYHRTHRQPGPSLPPPTSLLQSRRRAVHLKGGRQPPLLSCGCSSSRCFHGEKPEKSTIPFPLPCIHLPLHSSSEAVNECSKYIRTYVCTLSSRRPKI